MNRPPRLLLAVGLVITALALSPVFYLIGRSLMTDAEGWRPFTRLSVVRVFANSALLALLATGFGVLLGVPLAWLTVRTDLPFRRFWSVASVLPLAMPSYISAYAYIALLGPRGMVAQSLAPLGVERLPEIYGLAGAAFVITLPTTS